MQDSRTRAVFFVIAIVAALFGFGGIASAAAGMAKILFYIFLVLFAISLIFGAIRRGMNGIYTAKTDDY